MTFNAALDAYRDAVAKRAYWEDHGRRGDGNLEAAQTTEREARNMLFAIVSHDYKRVTR